MEEYIDFKDAFWNEKVKWKENGDITEDKDYAIRIDGTHYVAVTGMTHSSLRGFGGRTFGVRFIDGPHKGKEIESSNFWCQGGIPEEYSELLPDNAIFLKEGDK